MQLSSGQGIRQRTTFLKQDLPYLQQLYAGRRRAHAVGGGSQAGLLLVAVVTDSGHSSRKQFGVQLS